MSSNIFDLSIFFNNYYKDDSKILSDDLLLGNKSDKAKLWFITPYNINNQKKDLSDLIGYINKYYLNNKEHRILKYMDIDLYEFHDNKTYNINVTDIYHSNFRQNIFINISILLDNNFNYDNLHNIIIKYIHKFINTEKLIIFNLAYFYKNTDNTDNIANQHININTNKLDLKLIDDCYNNLIYNNFQNFLIKLIKWNE